MRLVPCLRQAFPSQFVSIGADQDEADSSSKLGNKYIRLEDSLHIVDEQAIVDALSGYYKQVGGGCQLTERNGSYTVQKGDKIQAVVCITCVGSCAVLSVETMGLPHTYRASGRKGKPQ